MPDVETVEVEKVERVENVEYIWGANYEGRGTLSFISPPLVKFMSRGVVAVSLSESSAR